MSLTSVESILKIFLLDAQTHVQMLRMVPEGFPFPHPSLSLRNAVDVGVPLNFGTLKLTKKKLCCLCAVDVGCVLMLRCPVKISVFCCFLLYIIAFGSCFKRLTISFVSDAFVRWCPVESTLFPQAIILCNTEPNNYGQLTSQLQFWGFVNNRWKRTHKKKINYAPTWSWNRALQSM